MSSQAYQEANESYQSAWRVEGERLRKQQKKAEQNLLAADPSNAVSLFGIYFYARETLATHDARVKRLMAERDALVE